MEILPTLERLGIDFVPFSPLDKGYANGKIDENSTFDGTGFRNTVPRFTPEARNANRALVELLGSIAQPKKATPSLMHWLLVPDGVMDRLSRHVLSWRLSNTLDADVCIKTLDGAMTKATPKYSASTRACGSRRESYPSRLEAAEAKADSTRPVARCS